MKALHWFGLVNRQLVPLLLFIAIMLATGTHTVFAAEYFSVGQIDGSQLADYAARRGMAQEQLRKYSFRNISSL